MAKAIPEGYHSITPYLVVNDAAAAIDYYNVHLTLKKPTDILAQTEKVLSMQS
ncbi:MAG TPA: hypothetical protein VF233_01465 [Nitrososphaeraceae archaeon]